MSKIREKTVFVGLSGGVDSSVAALRLKRAGFRVVGVFIKVWQPDFLQCDAESERLSAMRVAAYLDIPFLTLDAAEEYKREVGDYFVREYLAGRTPNPDVMCNKHVKFDAFLRFARAHGADFIATGHYAQIKEREGVFSLHRGLDSSKDQSYFLWTLGQNELSSTLFPVGDSNKETIRKEAAEAGLPTAAKKDSQGICFLGHVDIPDFLAHFIELREGEVVDEGGRVVGRHRGATVYTIGQRHGFEVFEHTDGQGPLYVTGKDIDANRIFVSAKIPVIKGGVRIPLEQVSFTGKAWPERPLSVQLRYRQRPIPAVLKALGKGYELELLTETTAAPAGQSIVFYHEDELLGGGVIK